MCPCLLAGGAVSDMLLQQVEFVGMLKRAARKATNPKSAKIELKVWCMERACGADRVAH